ncbi:MAG: zinc D-Ala-D-Ala carboxypeptidase [Actinomycetota bacterium]|nr:zinc D-Ala-D-Ala carboxypeptidase [Actinomycetota bacterium]
MEWLAFLGVPDSASSCGCLRVWIPSRSRPVGGHREEICSRARGRGRHCALRCHGVAVRARRQLWLCQIYSHEPWHYELRLKAIDHGCPPMYADPTHDPRMQKYQHTGASTAGGCAHDCKRRFVGNQHPYRADVYLVSRTPLSKGRDSVSVSGISLWVSNSRCPAPIRTGTMKISSTSRSLA